MSPRPAPHRDDAAAHRFLDAGAQLIDAMFVEDRDDRPARLRSIDFPAALQWVRVDDVIRVAKESGASGISRKAFHNRWPTKDDFVKDAILHTMLYRDAPATDPTINGPQVIDVAGIARESLSEATITLADTLLEALLTHPRSFLLMHIGPVLAQHPDLHAAVASRLGETRAPWYDGYASLMTGLNITLRPGWTIERLGLVITAMLDGFLLRSRVHTSELDELRWQGASLFADALIAFSLGVIDTDASGQSSRAALDGAVQRSLGGP
jgi:AcrR family transcriptional regulator